MVTGSLLGTKAKGNNELDHGRTTARMQSTNQQVTAHPPENRAGEELVGDFRDHIK